MEKECFSETSHFHKVIFETPLLTQKSKTQRQVKHTSTVLEPSIRFHTPVTLVDAEDIANERFRTHDLAAEVNNLATQLRSQNIEQSQKEHFVFTQSRDPNIKTKSL